jgi:hypothetical protein
MNERMNRIIEPLIIGSGSALTFILTYVSQAQLQSVQAVVAVVVGTATLVYTVVKTYSLIVDIKIKKGLKP